MESVATVLKNLNQSPNAQDWPTFEHWANLTALRVGRDGSFYVSNFWRGPLLYSLVLDKQPRNVLELGTGRGYSALSMAQAGVDAGLEMNIWTVDRNPPNERQQWAIDEGNGPRVESLSVEEVWDRHIPTNVRTRVRVLTGTTHSVLSNWRTKGHPAIDLVYIDGGHDYWTVKHDFVAALRVSNPGVIVVFDDYAERVRYGVKRLIDHEVAIKSPPGALTVIDTGAEEARPEADRTEHKMVLLRTSLRHYPPDEFYTNVHRAMFMGVYPYLMMVRQGIGHLQRSMRKV